MTGAPCNAAHSTDSAGAIWLTAALRFQVVGRNVDQQEAAEVLERLARAIADGEVTAPSGLVARLQGAAIALRASTEQTE